MKSVAVLAVLGMFAGARAETCTGFEDRLNTLAQQVQAMIDIVENMQPPGAPSCGGLIGTNVDSATFLTTVSTADGSGNEAYRYDSEWCCNQCRATSGCVFWSLQFVTRYRCQLYAEKDNGANLPGGYLFGQPYGYGDGVTRISGILPPAGMWGAQGSSQGSGEYMENVGTSSAKEWVPVSNPTAVIAEGYETCNSLGPYKPDWVGSSTANNGYPQTNWVQHPLECCSLCARSLDINGNAYPGNGANNPSVCAIWAYSYATNQRQCILRDNGYANYPADASELSDYQNNGAVCASTDTVGNPRYHPDNSPCTGVFEASRWSSGIAYGSDISTL